MRLTTAARRHVVSTVLPAVLCAVALAGVVFAAGADKVERPSITLKVTPAIGFAPVRMVFVAEIKGGDHTSLYCPAVEWDWGDDTKSETKADCDPFEPGTSELKRRYVVDHSFESPGAWKVQLRLKQKDKVVARGSVTVNVRPGLRDGGGIGGR